MRSIEVGDIVRVKGGTTSLTVRKIVGERALVEYAPTGIRAITHLIEIDDLERVLFTESIGTQRARHSKPLAHRACREEKRNLQTAAGG
jgi:hypothetical protein